MAENGQDVGDLPKSIAGSRPSSAARGGTMHWFAYVGPDPPSLDEEDREVRLRNLKERQNEERQKKLEEIKAQALAAQRYKEQKEAERKQRFEELRLREDSRRQQVEERKRAINEAERDRLDAILRRNQEREARIEARKRNDRHSMVFAFGSSTPRMLDPAPEAGSFWGHRRATSTQNIMCMSVPAASPGSACVTLTRRQSERELDGGSKKRATSAGGLERSGEDELRMTSSMYEIFGCSGQSTPGRGTNLLTRSSSAHFGTPPTTPAGCVSGYVGRRRTDLMPTIPTKDSSPGGGGGGSGMGTPRNKAFARSPGRAYSMSRLDQLSKPRKQRPADQLPPVSELAASRPLHHHHHHSQTQYATVSRSMSHLAGVGRQPAAGAALGLLPQRPLRKADSRSMHQLSVAMPVPPPRATRATQLRQQRLASASAGGGMNEASSRPGSALSQQSTTSVASSVNMRMRPIAAPRRPRPASIAVTGVTSSMDKGAADKTTKPPLPKSRKSSLVKSQEKLKKKPLAASPTEPSTPKAVASPTTHAPPAPIAAANHEDVSIAHTKQVEQSQPAPTAGQEETQAVKAQPEQLNNVQADTQQTEESSSANLLIDLEPLVPLKEEPLLPIVDEVKTESVEAKTTAAPAVAANTTSVEKSVEPVQINEPPPTTTTDGEQPEVVDMTASMIKVRINTEEEAKAALAERRRLAREEAERQAEAERLRIEEENRLELERQHREEEQQRLLIEQMRAAEQERLEEAIRETQRREEEERVRREEENRQKLLKEEADRKAREEAERQKAELAERLKHEEKEREARRKRVEAIMLRTRGKNNAPQQTEEKNVENSEHSEKVNGSNSENSENGHKNGKEIETVDNIIPVETLKNANTVNVDTLSTDDTLNSNNSWQHNNQQSDLLM